MLRLLIDQDLIRSSCADYYFTFQTWMSSPPIKRASVMPPIPIYSLGRQSRTASLSLTIGVRCLLTQQLVARGETVVGLITVSRNLPVSQVINDLEIIVSCGDVGEWENVLLSRRTSVTFCVVEDEHKVLSLETVAVEKALTASVR